MLCRFLCPKMKIFEQTLAYEECNSFPSSYFEDQESVKCNSQIRLHRVTCFKSRLVDFSFFFWTIYYDTNQNLSKNKQQLHQIQSRVVRTGADRQTNKPEQNS